MTTPQTISREWLQKTISEIEAMRDEIPFGLDEDERNTLSALKLALATMDSKFVEHIRKVSAEVESWPEWKRQMLSTQPAPVSVPDEQHSERFEWTYEDWANHLGGRHQNNDPACYYEFGSFMAVAEMLRQFGNVQRKVGWNACRAAMQAEPVTVANTLPEEKGSSLQLRNLIRQRHAEWSEKTFGNVGPVGPLKHLAKEAIEAAEAPDDLSEWADMQFLLWDAQRRAGICDGEITAAMEEKLKVNMARQWPEPKDGEPRLHIKTDDVDGSGIL